MTLQLRSGCFGFCLGKDSGVERGFLCHLAFIDVAGQNANRQFDLLQKRLPPGGGRCQEEGVVFVYTLGSHCFAGRAKSFMAFWEV